MPEIFGAALMGGGSGSAFAAIGAIYPVGAVCTCSYNGQTLTAKDTSGRALFLVPSAGQWLVKATNGGQEVEDTVSITTQGQVASVTLAFFTATIETTFPSDCTSVTCTKDDTVFSVPSGELSKGAYTFNIPEAGEWVLYATNGDKEKTVTVTVTEETEYSAKLNFELVILDGADTPVNWKYYISGGVSDVRPNSSGLSVGKNGYEARLFTATKIDLTEYNTLTFYMTAVTGATTYGVSPSLNQYGYPDSFSAQTKTSDAVTQIDVDITSIQSAYVMVFTQHSNPRTIQKIIAI